MKNKTSLIIPALSTNSFVEDLIVNVLNWSMFPNELIIINSSNKKYSINNNLKNNLKKNKIYLRIVNKKNLFPGAARNLGIKYSKHDYIIFLDVNTLPYDRDWFKINFNLILKKNLDGIIGQTFYLANSYKQKIIRASTYGKAYLNTLPGSIIKKNIVILVGKFNSESRAGEDTDWLRRLKKINPKIVYSKLPVYYKGLYESSYLSVVKKWFRNYFFSRNFPHLTIQKYLYVLILFSALFLFVFNWNYSSLCLFFDFCTPDTSRIVFPHITKLFLIACSIIYIGARGIYLPYKKKINLSFIFPYNFLVITFFSFILDLVKMVTFFSLGLLKILKLVR